MRAISALMLIAVASSCMAVARPRPPQRAEARPAAAVAKGSFGQGSDKSPRGSGPVRGVKRRAAPYASSRPASAAGPLRHTVRKGQTLYRIALSYGTTVQELCRANSIGDPGQVQVDRVLLIPRRGASPVSSRTATVAAQPAASDDSSGRFAGGIQSDVPAGPAALPTEGPASQAATLLPSLVPPDKVVSVTRKAAEKGEDLVDDQDPAGSEDAPSGVSFQLIPSREPFSWPVQGGTLRSEFGRRWGRLHAGVDISVPLGSPVYSARDGQVVYSGHKYRGYGNVVMIDHGDGFVTVYAHNSHNLVREGEKVVRGQMIARVGATGNATGSHCHFEIRHGNLAIDPRKYLSASAEEDEMYATGVPSTAASQDPDRAGLDSKPDPIP